MLISRGFSLLKNLRTCQANVGKLNQIVRNSSHEWTYRSAPPAPPRRNVLLAELVQGFAWWWVLWHLWTEPDHITGEFEYPDPSKWTDEELGIPSS